MKFLHTSDWHLGRRLMSVDILEHQGAFLAWLVTTATDEGVDAVVVAGDVFDRSLPSAESVGLLDRALADLADAGIPTLLIPGNHDHPVRLGYGGALFAARGIHVRSALSALTDPVILTDQHAAVGFYGIPYLLPDAVLQELDAERSHASVLRAAMARVRADVADRGLTRFVVAAHAFIVGSAEAEQSESERDISVGGADSAPADVFDDASYVALGHLHGAQRVLASRETIRYSGSPLAFSFSERHHTKSVTLVDLDADGIATVTVRPVPVPRPLMQVEGKLADVLAMAPNDQTGLAEAWVKVVITDAVRPESPMERLRNVWPHTIALDFRPDASAAIDDDIKQVTATTDPIEIVTDFYANVRGEQPDESTKAIIAEVVESTAPEALMHS